MTRIEKPYYAWDADGNGFGRVYSFDSSVEPYSEAYFVPDQFDPEGKGHYYTEEEARELAGPSGRIAPVPVEDQKTEAYSTYSDLSKDVYGMRMRLNPDNYTLEELHAMVDDLYASIRADIEAREKAKHEAMLEANKKAHARRVFDSKFNSIAVALQAAA